MNCGYMIETVNPNIFRAYDIRGLYGKDIDPTVFYRIGLGAGTYLQKEMKKSKITVGNDLRQSSHPLVHAFIAGLSATGIMVTSCGTTSFGQTLFAGWKNNQDLISFITASHLPPEWNGVKFYFGDGVGLPEEELMKIRDIVLKQRWIEVPWNDIPSIQTIHPQKSYEDFFVSKFSYKNRLKVAVDCGGASMTLSAPFVLEKLGLDVVKVYCDPDPSFSQRPSDPKPENLEKLVSTVKNENCDFGVAFDGDGDRSVIVDDTGSILSADQTGIIIGKYGLEKRSGTVIVNVECSKAVEEQLTPLGYTVKQIQVGHTFLTLHAKKEGSPLGIESSGHLILPAYFLFDDALVIPLKIAEILDKTSQQLHFLAEEIPMYPRKKLEITCSDDTKFDIIKQLSIQCSNEYEQVNLLDGVRVNLENGWVLIRASNTSPIIRLTAEANTIDDVEELASLFETKTKKLIEEIQTPVPMK
jgi:phosphomannomutase